MPVALRFIEALNPPRDHLYALALAKSPSPAAAETALQQAARDLFPQVAQDTLLDIPAAMEQSLATAGPIPTIPMPADVWARLAAAIQIEAARSENSHALNPDSVLLRPDPLLAPKKSTPRDDADLLDLTSPSRLFIALGAALLVGLLATIYILTRPAPQRPATHPASTLPAGTP